MAFKNKNCKICNKEFNPASGVQVFCIDCRDQANKIRQNRWYYKDTLRTKASKNKYNRSIKGKASKLRWYHTHKDQVMNKQLTVYRKETLSRIHAHDLMKRHFPDKICSVCNIKSKIHVHHKDVNPFNNSLDNLIYLCSSCHGKEHERLRTMALYPNVQ